MTSQPSTRFERNVPVPMRDETVLRADVYRPDDREPHPVLVNRTPYGKDGVLAFLNTYRAAQRGYVVVVQDCRGRYASEGDWYPFLNEGEDGYDTIEWAAAQPWSTGKVGMFGPSYMGVTQWLCAMAQPPHLATIAPSVTASDYHDGWVYQSGAFLLGFALSWTLSSFAVSQAPRLGLGREETAALQRELVRGVEEPGPSYGHLPVKDLPLLQHPGLAPYYQDWLEHPSEDEYWKRWMVQDSYSKIGVPVLNIGGWYDIFLGGTLRNFTGMRLGGGSPEAREHSQLIVGPWAHAGAFGNVVGDINFGSGATGVAIGLGARVGKWFDYWLKGERNGITDEPPVTVFTMGAGEWKTLERWPGADVEFVQWYLHSRGKANSLEGDGALTPEAPSEEQFDCYLYDPRNPVPTKGGGLCCSPTMLPGGPFDQRPIESRPDVLVYTSGPLERDMEVTGPLTVKLWASSSAIDTDFTAKLVDVHPNGYAQNLVDNLVRARYRESAEDPVFLEPDKSYEYTIDLYATSNVFKAGHAIRLEISSSNFPRFDRNTNTGGLIAKERETRPALQMVFHDVRRPSHVVLPTVPA